MGDYDEFLSIYDFQAVEESKRRKSSGGDVSPTSARVVASLGRVFAKLEAAGEDPHDVFCAFDADGNGLISPEEFHTAFESLGGDFDFTSVEVMALVEHYDLNKDG